MSYAHIMKANPFRDKAGRFSSKDGGKTATMALGDFRSSLGLAESPHPVLDGVVVSKKPTTISPKIAAKNVSFHADSFGTGTAPKDKNQGGRWLFDSAPSGFRNHSTDGGTFAVSGKYSQAKQKAIQQAAAWGHNQVRIAP